MSQHAYPLKPVSVPLPSPARPGLWLERLIAFLRQSAGGVGYFLSFCGWIGFWFNVYCFIFSEQEGVAEALAACGQWIVPGWLLLRFSAGLFPFSARLFSPYDK